MAEKEFDVGASATALMQETKNPVHEEHKARGAALLEGAQAYQITTADEAQTAGDRFKSLGAYIAQVNGLLDPFCAMANKMHKHFTGLRGAITKDYAEAKSLYGMALSDWERKERKRIEGEQRIKDEEAKAAAAKEAEENKQPELAKAIEKGVMPVAAAPVEKKKVEGVAMVDTWKYEITDEAALPREYLIPNEKGIGAFVRAMKDNAVGKIAGVRVYMESRPR